MLLITLQESSILQLRCRICDVVGMLPRRMQFSSGPGNILSNYPSLFIITHPAHRSTSPMSLNTGVTAHCLRHLEDEGMSVKSYARIIGSVVTLLVAIG